MKVSHTLATPLPYRAATALDVSLSAAACKRGIYTDKARNTLATYLDGAVNLKAKTVRRYIKYLQMVAR